MRLQGNDFAEQRTGEGPGSGEAGRSVDILEDSIFMARVLESYTFQRASRMLRK